AQQDATTNATAGLSAQTANQDLNLTGYKSLIDSAQKNEDFGYATKQNEQNIQGNLTIQKQAQEATAADNEKTRLANTNLQTTLKNMDITLDTTKLAAQERDSFTSASSPVIQQVQAEISNIQRTPDEVMSPEAKAAAINYQNESLRAQLTTLSSLYNYKMDWPAVEVSPTVTPTATPGTVAAPAA